MADCGKLKIKNHWSYQVPGKNRFCGSVAQEMGPYLIPGRKDGRHSSQRFPSHRFQFRFSHQRKNLISISNFAKKITIPIQIVGKKSHLDPPRKKKSIFVLDVWHNDGVHMSLGTGLVLNDEEIYLLRKALRPYLLL